MYLKRQTFWFESLTTDSPFPEQRWPHLLSAAPPVREALSPLLDVSYPIKDREGA